MGRRGRGFASNYRRASGLGLAASRRTAPRLGDRLRLLDRATAIFRGLQSGFIVLIGLINNFNCDDVVEVLDILL